MRISKENRKKANYIYNLCIIYFFVAAALAVPFLVPLHLTAPKNPAAAVKPISFNEKH
jgi:hypothetical protein